MTGYIHNIRRYFIWGKEEWLALLATAATGGLVLGFLSPQSGAETFNLSLALSSFLLNGLGVFGILSLQLLGMKLAGIRWGFQVVYDKYLLGLLVGVFIAFLSFGYIPFFVTGKIDYIVIRNLRIGKFRATMAKNWETALTAGSGPLTSILLTIPLSFLHMITGLELFHQLVVIAILVSVFTLLPLPLIQTANPYTVYMSRLEALEGNLPGYDVFFGSRGLFAFLAGMVVCFSLLALFFTPSVLLLLFSVLLGVGTIFVWGRVERSFN